MMLLINMKTKPKFFDADGKYSADYNEHIQKYPYLSSSRVFRAFGSEFFHDGKISNINISPHINSVELTISAPNFYVNEDQIFLSADFLVRFTGVSHFSISCEDAKLDENNSSSLTFLHAEFNSLGLLSETAKLDYCDFGFTESDGKCELLMDCVADHSIYLSLCFSSFEIEAKNPTLFYLIAKRSGFDYNYFSS